jgi:integrase
MASIERYTTAAGTRYSVRYRTPSDTQTKKRGFRTKREAELFLANTEVRKATGDYVKPTMGRVTVGSLGAEWLDRKRSTVKRITYVNYEHIWRRQVLPRWGTVPIAAVDVLGVEAWVAELLRQGLGAGIVRKAASILGMVMGDAVKGKRIATNPVKAIENFPEETGKRRVYLTDADVARLAAEADEAAAWSGGAGVAGRGRNGALVLTLAYCGLRWGEAAALRVRDIEFLKGRLSVTRNAVVVSGGGHDVGLPKGDKPRSVPVPRFVLDALSVQCIGKGPDDLVFPSVHGGFMGRQPSYTGWFAGAVKRAGIQRITPHDLRHTCASLAVSAGANVLALSKMLGHSKPSITLDVYADLFDSDLDAVAEALHNRRTAAQDASAR